LERQATILRNAALADARWAAKPSLVGAPPPPKGSVFEGIARFAEGGKDEKKDTCEAVERREEVGTWDAGNVVPRQR